MSSRSCCRKVEARRKYASAKSETVLRMKNAEYHSASRKLIVLRNGSRAPENISDSPDGMNNLCGKIPVDLVAQPADQHVNDVGLRIEAVVPDVFQNHCFRHRTARITHQIFEQGKFARLQLEPVVPPLRLAGEQIENQFADDQPARFGGPGSTADQRVDA